MPNLDDTISAGQTGHITDHQTLANTYNVNTFRHNPLLATYGAVGNSHHNTGGGNDDWEAIQNALEDAQAVGGQAVVPLFGGHSYGITQTLELAPDPGKPGVHLLGIGSIGGDGQVTLPNLVWNGAAGGVMVQNQSSATNMHSARMENIRLAGRLTAATHWRMKPTGANNASIDIDSGARNCVFAACTGNSVRIEVSGARFWMEHCRWDHVDGYPFSTTAEGNYQLNGVFVDHWAGGDPGHGKGFAELDMSGTTDKTCKLELRNFYSEVNNDLVETTSNGGAGNPGETAADRRGLIRCIINSSTQRVQHMVNFTGWTVISGWNSGRASYCVIQMAGGTLAQHSGRIMARMEFVRSMAGDGTATTGHVIPLGNIPAADKSTYTGSTNYLEWKHALGGGGIFTAETPRVWAKLATP